MASRGARNDTGHVALPERLAREAVGAWVRGADPRQMDTLVAAAIRTALDEAATVARDNASMFDGMMFMGLDIPERIAAAIEALKH